jgi:hypothetical protein
VLGAEETWHTPSLLLAAVSGGDGKVVFSQVHLEVDPTQYEDEESKFAALKESNSARLEIIQDLLSTHLGLQCTASQKLPTYTPGYFLGRHEVRVGLVCFWGLEEYKCSHIYLHSSAHPPSLSLSPHILLLYSPLPSFLLIL